MLSHTGLTSEEVKDRLKRFGYNELKRTKKRSAWKIFISQFTSPLTLILIAVAILSFVLGYFPGQDSNLTDTILILVIVVISGIAGFIQDYKSEKTIEALQKMAVPKAKVIRDGTEQEVLMTEIVPGDVVLLDAGDVVPADAKLIDSYDLKVDESILTGESRAVHKNVDDDVYMNTHVVSGNAVAVVLKTGMKTKIGEIASKLQQIEDQKTPFDKEIDVFSKKVSLMIIGITVVILLVGLIKYNWYTSLLTAVSLAVAAIPEGLPAVIVLTLASAAKTMSKKNALIRKLNVTESLGSVNVICTDKTGTITEGKMKVRDFYFDKVYNLDEIRNVDEFTFKITNTILNFCNDAKSVFKEDKNVLIGDETDVAFKQYSEDKPVFDFHRTKEIPFSSKRKMMSVLGKIDDVQYILTKGAPEVVIERCDFYLKEGKVFPISKEIKQRILEQNKAFAQEGKRVLALAYKDNIGFSGVSNLENLEHSLVFVGLVSLNDPPRPEVKKAIEECKNAGIRVIMITGDNPDTALAIAKEVGIESHAALVGTEIDKLSDFELEEKLKTINVFARVDPMHKLRLLEILQRQGNIVAMTGDGVNDSLALKKADVGIAMGIKGTDVAKEASDMILLDDNFATITVAIKEGRRVFDNIRKFVNYLFVCNFAEVGVLFLATLFLTLKEPVLLPVHLLWINLLTDGLPALALGVDPPVKDIMKRPPRKINEPIINKQLMTLIFSIGTKKMLLLFLTFFIILRFGLPRARTALFTGFILYEFVRIASIRAQEKLNFFSNKLVVLSLVFSLLLQLFVIYSPLNRLLDVVPLGIFEWGILIIGTLVGYMLAIFITRIVVKYIPD
ncbi:MAG: P-type Ca2+ transporter type [Candidatus Woesearchaeota archaeon]|nr:P-type Ca2+ transporter type [Candidatus Woesearchaeota archaeon]MDN5328100.1 P-type Ca2+ transporter type [Candidatus Woesearchaeota archaeon]